MRDGLAHFATKPPFGTTKIPIEKRHHPDSVGESAGGFMVALRRLAGETAFRLCLVLWVFGYILVDLSATLQGRSAVGIMLAANLPLLALGLTLSLLLGAMLHRLADARAVARWPLLALAVVAAGTVQCLADIVWLRLLALTVFPAWQSWALSTDPSRFFTIYLLYTWTMALSAALIWSARTSDIARLNKARAAAFEAAAARAEAAALRMQLNPHFLFNALNGIASLVVARKSGQAEEMIGRLADFLRSALAADPAAMIPLRQELATISAYLHVEEARFGERLRVSWQIDEQALDCPVPNFLLQPLIENAVKHGVAPSRAGSLITISASLDGAMLRLCVEDSAPKAARVSKRPEDSLGVGLRASRERLERLFGSGFVLDGETLPTGYRSTLVLPRAAAAGA
jgi:two-component system, LytTR family, sensor kinase